MARWGRLGQLGRAHVHDKQESPYRSLYRSAPPSGKRNVSLNVGFSVSLMTLVLNYNGRSASEKPPDVRTEDRHQIAALAAHLAVALRLRQEAQHDVGIREAVAVTRE